MVSGEPGGVLDLLDLGELAPDVFEGPPPGMPMQPLFGGHVIGQAVVAASRSVGPGRPIASLHSYFLLPGDAALPIRYEVERVRDGRSFATRRVVARQDDRTIFILSASFHVPTAGFEHQMSMPPAPDPGELPSLMDTFLATFGGVGEWASLDIRWGGPPEPGDPTPTEPHNQIWVRAKEPIPEDPALHAAVFGYLSDFAFLTPVLLPHGKVMWSRDMQVSSLDHAVWFHRSFGVNDWLLYDQVSPVGAGARGLALGALYTADGVRVASTAQEGLVRPRG